MKKRLVAVVLVAAMVLGCVSALAEEDVFARFQPYTNVDLSVFKSAGYTSYYDEFKFNAELSPASNSIGGTVASLYKEIYTIKLDLKLIYSAGTCYVVPRMIFQRSGSHTYYDGSMSTVYIKNAENRYEVDVSGCSRSSNSKSGIALDSSVEPIRAAGYVMLTDLANSTGNSIMVSFNGSEYPYEFTKDDKEVIASFYNDCVKAGVFEQESLYSYSDDYSIITLFNEGSTGTEDATAETETEPTAE